MEAVPAPGCTFSHWSGVVTGTANPIYIYSDANKTITANFTPPASAMSKLYFPHVASQTGISPDMWETEICLINTGNQAISGTLKPYKNNGRVASTGKNITLAPHGRWSRIVGGGEFTNPSEIGYMFFESTSDSVAGYTKFYIAGQYRVAIPAVQEVNTSNIYIPHIASSAEWWTGVSLVNTTPIAKTLTMTFNNGQNRFITLNAREHRAFDIASLFDHQTQPDLQSAVITNADGVIGLELFGSVGGNNQLEGILLTGSTASTLYYPHVADDGWWTGIAAYNPSDLGCTITITPYSSQGGALTTSTLFIAGRGKYIGAVAALDLPAQTAWFRIDATRPVTGFELLGDGNDSRLAAYAGGGETGAKAGVFPKIEKSGWTDMVFVNTEAVSASVTLTAFDDNGTPIATQALTVGGHAKMVDSPEKIFSQDISRATYIVYAANRDVVGFQLNGSADGTMLDGLPGLAVTQVLK
ncbi:MAG: hypothetical protein JXL20_03390 [Deltaproteobacteria bacterium]|nr:hypothetical protein [Deltaproteobacteria bacterium]